MKLRHVLLVLASLALIASGCGSDSDDAKSKDKPQTKEEKAQAQDAENKDKNLKSAQAAFKKDDDDVGVCRNLAMAWIAKASPASSTDPKKPPKLPEDREESLKEAVDTLEGCVKIDGKDRDVKVMLSSTYMATNEYEKAAALLKDLAKTAKPAEKANAYYAWGLAASNAQQYDDAITAWNRFVETAPKKDPRIAQVKQSIKALRAAKNQPKPASGDGDSKDGEDGADAESSSSSSGEDGEDGEDS